MKIITKLTLIIILSICLPHLLTAQRWDVGFNAGFSGYQGDLNSRFVFKPRLDRVTLGGFIRIHMGSKFAFRGSMIYSYLSGSDREFDKTGWRYNRGFSFKSNIREVAGLIEWNIFQSMPSYDHLSFSPYLFTGIGWMNKDTKTDFNEPNNLTSEINLDKNVQQSNFHMVWPIGGGVKWHISQLTTLAIEGGYRNPFTDYLDGVSKSAQPRFKDWYFFGLASISQKIGGKYFKEDSNNGIRVRNLKVKCPKLR